MMGHLELGGFIVPLDFFFFFFSDVETVSLYRTTSMHLHYGSAITVIFVVIMLSGVLLKKNIIRYHPVKNINLTFLNY